MLSTYLADTAFLSHVEESWAPLEATQLPAGLSHPRSAQLCLYTHRSPAGAVHSVPQQQPVSHLPALSSLKPWQAHMARELMGKM